VKVSTGHWTWRCELFKGRLTAYWIAGKEVEKKKSAAGNKKAAVG